MSAGRHRVSKSMLLQIVRQPDVAEMHALIDRITGDGITREEARQFNRDPEKPRRRKPKNFTYRYQPESKAFQITLRFADQTEVPRPQLIRSLQETLERLIAEERADDARGVDH